MVVDWIDGKTVVTEANGQRIREVYYPSVWAYRPGKPTVQPNTPLTPDEEAQHLVDDLSGENQLHKCAVAENGCKATPDSACKRHFDRFIENDRTTFDEYGRPVYRRPTRRDLNVVGHNQFMLVDWGAHHNVESAVSVLSILYLYNYLFKGNKKVIGRAMRDPDRDAEDTIDEIEVYLKGRLLCAHDCTNRALGYETYPATQPSVATIAVKTESQVAYYTSKKNACDMYVYMETRHIEALQHMTFEQLFTEYYATYDTPSPTRLSRGPQFCYEIKSPKNDKQFYIFKYIDNKPHLVRMEMLYPSVGDAWYLRLILQRRPVKNWRDARCSPPQGEPGSIEYVNHQEAARAAGYLVGELFDEAFLCFTEAVVSMDRTPYNLRSLFASLTLQGFVTGNILKEDTLVDALLQDYVETQGNTKAQAFTLFLLDLRKRLKQEMKTLEDFGLHLNPQTHEPWELDNRTELQDERDRYDASAQLELFNDLNNTFPANAEQTNAFNQVMEAMQRAKDNQQQQFVCIHGAAGTGKSIVCQKIAAKVRSEGKLVSICASTTLAATNFENADTAHSLFAYAVEDDDDDFDGDTLQECQLDTKAYEDRLELLLQTSVIVWDEVFCNHRKLFEAAVRALKQNKTLVWVLVGDTRQPLVVIQGANDMDVIGATITSSPLWNKCTVAFLKENKRLTALQASINEHSTPEQRQSATNQILYADAILQLSEGRCENANFMCNVLQNTVGLRQTSILAFLYVKYFPNTNQGCDDAIEWLHPERDLSNLNNLRNKIILALTNERVDYWNKKIQDFNPNAPRTLLSHDYFSDVDDPNGILKDMLTETLLNSYTNTQVPNHELILKVGDICLVTRALKASGLASNSRVVIKSISFKLVKVVTLEQYPRIVFIPRIRFKFHLQRAASYNMTRVQFPLRLCYSMTTNKSQGQSMEQVLLDLTDDPFSHGQTYVAWSRVRRYDKIRLIVRPDMLMDYEDFDTLAPIKIPMTVNVVFPSVIQRNPE